MSEHVFVRTDATILHADLDAFYASVEQRDDPSLRGKPVIVGGGVVLAASYEAKAFGVRKAMGGGAARRVCPQAIVVPPRMSAYSEASREVFAVFDDTTPLVEGISIDEAFLDVAGLRKIAGAPVEIAARLRAAVRERVGLPITVGVARTKFLAKVASTVAKPDGLLLVPPERELEFLHPLPVQLLWGVGHVSATKLHERGITTVGQVAALSEATITAMLGRASGHRVWALSNNHDPRPLEIARRRRSMGAQRALGRSQPDLSELDAILIGLVERVTRRMRRSGRVGRTVTVRMRFDDFTRATRSHTVARSTQHTETILGVVRALIDEATPMIAESGLTLVGISVGNLDDDDAMQLALPFDQQASSAVDTVLDAVREKFGTTALSRAVLLGQDPGLVMPMLPD